MGAGQLAQQLLRKRFQVTSSSTFVDLTHLRRMRGREQVAAVCYRRRGEQLEFLLVQTDGGRWTFPKGNAEPGLSNAQSAALEAFEEAGVHGRIEEAEFARYTRRKRVGAVHHSKVEVVIHAHLCEVLWLEKPKEPGRNPTWFDAEKARRRLRERRRPEDGAEHCRVLELAVLRAASARRSFRAASLDR
ncbi:MAG: NUDIX domain-containing protein [Terriglobales bacterium]